MTPLDAHSVVVRLSADDVELLWQMQQALRDVEFSVVGAGGSVDLAKAVDADLAASLWAEQLGDWLESKGLHRDPGLGGRR